MSVGAFLQRALMTSKHLKDEVQNFSWTPTGTQNETTNNSRYWFVRTHSIQGQRKDIDSSCNLHHQEELENIFHTARELNLDYPSERQTNCETRWRQCENWTNSGGDHISIRTISWEHRCGTVTSRWSYCSHISCKAPTTRIIRAFVHQQDKENNPTDLENLYPQTCLKKEGECGDFKKTSRNLEACFKKVSRNERRTYLTNFATMSTLPRIETRF